MASKYDIEKLLSEMSAFMKANLSTKLSAIDTEKNDGITLAAVETGAYFLQHLSEATANYNPFILYGIDDIESGGGIGPATRKPYKLFVVVALTDSANDPSIIPRLFRYQRALEDLFESDWSSIAGSVK